MNRRGGLISALGTWRPFHHTDAYSLLKSAILKPLDKFLCLDLLIWKISWAFYLPVSVNFTEIRCPEPELPTHAIISVTGNDRVYGRTLIRTSNDALSQTTYKIGALVKYRCERGYKILGDPLSTCEENGKWSGEIPHCDCQYLIIFQIFMSRIEI